MTPLSPAFVTPKRWLWRGGSTLRKSRAHWRIVFWCDKGALEKCQLEGVTCYPAPNCHRSPIVTKRWQQGGRGGVALPLVDKRPQGHTWNTGFSAVKRIMNRAEEEVEIKKKTQPRCEPSIPSMSPPCPKKRQKWFKTESCSAPSALNVASCLETQPSQAGNEKDDLGWRFDNYRSKYATKMRYFRKFSWDVPFFVTNSP